MARPPSGRAATFPAWNPRLGAIPRPLGQLVRLLVTLQLRFQLRPVLLFALPYSSLYASLSKDRGPP